MSFGTWYATLGLRVDNFVQGVEGARASMGRLGIGALAAGGAIALGLKSAFNAASSLNETMNAAQVVFQDSIDVVSKFGDAAAQAFGESKQQAVQASLVFGNLFRTVGEGSGVAAQQAIELTKRAADIASVYNVSIQKVLDALRSGLTGQARPLRQYGILINEARVSAEALAETHKKDKTELTEGERVLARYNLIMKDSAITQGDFGNTANQAANRLRIAHAEIENAKAAIGQGLLPVVAQAAKSVGSFANAIATLPPALLRVGVSGASAVAAFLILGGSILKATSVIGGMAGGLRRLGDSIGVSTLGLGLFSIAATAIAIGLGQMYVEAQRTKQAFDNFDNSIKIMGSAIQNMMLATGQSYANATGALRDLINANNQMISVGEAFNKVEAETARQHEAATKSAVIYQGVLTTLSPSLAALKNDSAGSGSLGVLGNLGPVKSVLSDIGGIIRGQREAFSWLPWVKSNMDKVADSENQVGTAFQEITRLMQDPSLDTTRFETAFQSIVTSFLADPTHNVQAFIDQLNALVASVGQYTKYAADGKLTTDAFNSAVDDGIDKAHQDAETKSVQAEVQRKLNKEYLDGTNLLLPYTRHAEDVIDATAKFTQSLADLVHQTAVDNSSLTDLEKKLGGISEGFGKAGTSIALMLIHANKLGDISITDSGTRRALLLANDLQVANEAIDKTSSKIEANSTAINKWQGYRNSPTVRSPRTNTTPP
jgi:hypothetical protein